MRTRTSSFSLPFAANSHSRTLSFLFSVFLPHYLSFIRILCCICIFVPPCVVRYVYFLYLRLCPRFVSVDVSLSSVFAVSDHVLYGVCEVNQGGVWPQQTCSGHTSFLFGLLRLLARAAVCCLLFLEYFSLGSTWFFQEHQTAYL